MLSPLVILVSSVIHWLSIYNVELSADLLYLLIIVFNTFHVNSCRLDYCNSLLYNVPMHKIDRMQRLQNQCARMLTKSPRREHITPV